MLINNFLKLLLKSIQHMFYHHNHIKRRDTPRKRPPWFMYLKRWGCNKISRFFLTFLWWIKLCVKFTLYWHMYIIGSNYFQHFEYDNRSVDWFRVVKGSKGSALSKLSSLLTLKIRAYIFANWLANSREWYSLEALAYCI